MGRYDEDEDDIASEPQQNGTNQRFFHSVRGSAHEHSFLFQSNRLRVTASSQSLCSGIAVPTQKNRQSSLSSVCAGMSRLTLNDVHGNKDDVAKNQAVSRNGANSLAQQQPPESLPENTTFRSLRKAPADISGSPSKARKAVPEDKGRRQKPSRPINQSNPPKTPVAKEQDDVLKLMATVERSFHDIKTPKTNNVSTSPTKSVPPFLTKDSNTRGFAAFDVAERLRGMEAQFLAFKDKVNGSLADKEEMEKTVVVVKSNCTCRGPNSPTRNPG